MNGKCADIGLIQAYLDGELGPAESAELTAHVGMCERCSSEMAEAEMESAAVFAALGGELDALVPTQRLWSKINSSIEESRSRSLLDRFAGFISFVFASPSLAAAAALLLVAGIALTFVLKRPDAVEQAFAPVPTAAESDTRASSTGDSALKPVSTQVSEPADTRPHQYDAPTAVKASFTTTGKPPLPRTGTPSAVQIQATSADQTYQRTIAALSATAANQKDTLFSPSERVAFERSLALVDDSITRLQAAVRKDPKNDPARQALYANYQTKIDLLSSVTQKEELVASLK